LVWCCVKADNDDSNKDFGTFWEIAVLFYKWINIILITYKFHVTIKYFNTRENDIRNRNDKIEERNYIRKSKFIMYAFPIILIILKVPCLIDWIISTVFNDTEESLLFLEAICGPLIGFFNSLIFLFIHRRFI